MTASLGPVPTLDLLIEAAVAGPEAFPAAVAAPAVPGPVVREGLEAPVDREAAEDPAVPTGASRAAAEDPAATNPRQAGDMSSSQSSQHRFNDAGHMVAGVLL